MEIRTNQARASARTLFNETYDALVQTLRDTYPTCKELPVRSPDHDMALEWHTCMGQHQKRVATQDKTLMLANVSVLLSLHIPQLWIDGQFTKTSERYIWMYLANLNKFAGACIVQQEEEKKARPGSVDIKPPSNAPGPLPGIQQLYNELPQNMFKKVKDLADKYSADIESGAKTVDDIKFDEISKELFSQIDPEEMHQVVTSVSSLLQGVMSGEDGELGDLFKMFTQGVTVQS